MKVGTREVVYTATVLIPSREEAWLEFSVGGWLVKLNLLLVAEEAKPGDATPTPRLSIEAVDDHARLVLYNWSNALGTATSEPVEMGRASNGQVLSVMVWHVRTGEADRIDLQFLLGAKP